MARHRRRVGRARPIRRMAGSGRYMDAGSCGHRHRRKSLVAQSRPGTDLFDRSDARQRELHQFARHRPPLAAQLPGAVLGRRARDRVGGKTQSRRLQPDRRRPYPGRHRRPAGRHSPRHAQSRGGADPRRPQLCRICRGSPLSRLHRHLAHRPSGKRHRLSAQAQSMGQLAGGERRRHRPQPAALHGQSAVYRLSRRRCGFCSVAEFGHRRTQPDQRCARIIGRSARDQLRSRDGRLAARPH